MNSSFSALSIGNQILDFTWDDLNPTYQTVNSADMRLGFSHFVSESKNVDEVMIFLGTNTGTVSYGDIQLDIYEMNLDGTPDLTTSLGTTTATSTGSYSATNWNKFTFSTAVSLTGGKYYAFIFRNINASPTTNYWRFSRFTAYQLSGDGMNYFDNGYKYSNTAGSTWTRLANQGMYRVGYDDGSYEGFPVRFGIGMTIGSIYAGSGVGYCFRITTPSYKIKISQIQLALDKIGTITGGTVGCQIYDSSFSLVATSLNTMNAVTLSTTGYEYGFLFDNITLDKEANYYILPYYPVSKTGTGYLAVMCGACYPDSASRAIFDALTLSAYPCSHNGSTFTAIVAGDYPWYIIPVRLWGNLNEPIISDGGALPTSYSFC